MDVCSRIAEVLAGNPNEPAIEFDTRWYSRGEIRALGEHINALLDAAGVPVDAPIGVVARNRVAHAAVILGLLGARRSVSMIYAFQSPTAIARDLSQRRLVAVIAEGKDWTEPVLQGARQCGCVGIAIEAPGTAGSGFVSGLERAGQGPFREAAIEPAIEVLSSGTTGAPKCIRMEMPKLIRSLSTAMGGAANAATPVPILATFPFGGIGGLCSLIASACLRVPLIVLEKFTVEGWVGAVKRNRLQRAGGPAVAFRMLLDAKVAPEDLASLRYVVGGASAFDTRLLELFEKTYGVQVLWAYGATEFAGTVAAWTPALREEFGNRKHGSAGRALPDAKLRVVDGNDGRELAPGEHGFLEVHVPVISAEWMRTTDIASVDADGFLFIHGRGDGAIVRGGFKIIPETINHVLRQHPGVGDAATVALDDKRLGQVPVVAVEWRPGVPVPTEAELKDHIRESLPAHHVPVQVKLVAALPRTQSLKPDLRAVAALFSGEQLRAPDAQAEAAA